MKHADKPHWHAWYDSAAWRGLRAQTFARDSLICQLCGIICSGRAPAPHSPVCDHKIPHRGNAALFRDPANLWTLCKGCHDSDKQGQEVRGYSRAPDATGWPSDPRHPANRKA